MSHTVSDQRTHFRTDVVTALVANFLVLGTLIFAGLLERFGPELYYVSVQEDEILEWGTFWTFIFAAAASVVGAIRQHRVAGKLPWFLTGVALFCLWVALEEISWGQRILGYRPPVYFLEHNYQQEFNLHNVVDTQYRKLALKAVILGYGVLLPLAALVPVLKRLLQRLAVVSPPASLIPAFAATFALYVWYPWRHTGEWVEFMLGAGFMFAALMRAREYRAEGPVGGGKTLASPVVPVLAAWVLVLGLGSATAAASRSQRSANPDNIEAARIEIAALQRDFASGKVRTRCRIHKRLYTYMEQYRQRYLLQGEFAGLVPRGLPEERADFLLDPWNSPYWIRHNCEGSRSRIFVYSFGPNRRRDSTRWEIVDDDIGAYIEE